MDVVDVKIMSVQVKSLEAPAILDSNMGVATLAPVWAPGVLHNPHSLSVNGLCAWGLFPLDALVIIWVVGFVVPGTGTWSIARVVPSLANWMPGLVIAGPWGASGDVSNDDHSMVNSTEVAVA